MEVIQLNELEAKYNFQYPELYKQLCKDKMLSTGKFGPNWYKDNYSRLKDEPLFLLWSSEVEILEEFQLEEYICDMKDPEMWNLKEDVNLIPFAANHGGDLYCFYYNEQKGDDIPIVLLSHDGDYSKILSKNLQDFIFRIFLETSSDINYSVSRAMTEQQNEERKQQKIHEIKAMFNNHKRYLTPKFVEILEKIYQRNVMLYNEMWGFISIDAAEVLLKQEIDFSLLNKQISFLN